MRKNDPIKAQYISIGIFLGLLFVALIYLIVRNRSDSFLLSLYGIGLLLLLVMYGYIANTLRRVHKRTEERRRRTLEGDQALLAEPQPVPDARALPLPTTIRMLTNTKFVFAWMSFMFLVMLITFIVVFSFLSGDRFLSQPSGWLFFGIVFVLLLVVFFAAFWLNKSLYGRRLKQEITVNEQGITTTYFGKTTTVPWDEAQCFDIWGAKTTRMLPFEVVGKEDVAHWSAPNRYRFFYPFRPASSYEEYYHQLKALQQVIVAKTGHPMYDLRDKQIVWW